MGRYFDVKSYREPQLEMFVLFRRWVFGVGVAIESWMQNQHFVVAQYP